MPLTSPSPAVMPAPPALRRLLRVAPLGLHASEALLEAIHGARHAAPRQELLTEGRAIPEAMLIVSGWAARVRILVDGRRQFLSFLLPGDLIGICGHDRPLAVSTVVAITDCRIASAPSAADLPDLQQAFAVSRAIEEAYLLAQITRLGRLNALDRIYDLLLELHERLDMAGLVHRNSFEVPLTQEMLADALGLTPVHINRMLQQGRRNGDLEWRGTNVTLSAPAHLAHGIGRAPLKITAET